MQTNINNTKPLLIDTGRGLTIEYKNKNLYSKYNPEKSTTRYVNNIIFKEHTIYLIPSPLLNYGEELLNNKIPTNSIILKIEIDPNLYEITNNKIEVKLILRGFDFIEALQGLDFSKYKKCELLRLTAGYDLYKDKYDKLYTLLLNSLHNFWKNRYTATQMGQLWIKNCFINLKELNKHKPLNKLKVEKPILIIGAGESVEKVLPEIIKLRDKLHILCVDTALQVLLEANIKPDTVLALEAQYYNLPDFYGAKNLDINLIYDISSYPAVTRNLIGEKYYIATKFSNSLLLDKLHKNGIINTFLPPLGSVGITAINIALQITNCNVYLSGLDFSYTMGKTHSNGSPYHLTRLITWNKIKSGDSYGECLKRPLSIREDKSGNKIYSDNILFEYSLHTKQLLSGETRVFDITESGMDLGVKRIKLESFKDHISTVQETLSSTLEGFIPKDPTCFLEEELNSLNTTIVMISDYFTDPSETKLDMIKKQLHKIKYFFEHYPEVDLLKDINSVYLTRIYYTLIRFRRVLK